MVTHSATMIQQQHEEQHQLESARPRRRMLAKEDPMSHRIIEKRRRDRMNNCLADLSRLIPADYLKKGRGRIEKTEIIEMAIKHIKYLQAQACRQMESCGSPAALEHYRVGYQDCLAEALHFMVEVEGYFAGDPVCVQLVNHLQKHCDKMLDGEQLNSPRTATGESSSSSGSCSGGGYGPHAATGSSSGFRSGSSPGSGSGSDAGGGNKEAPPPPAGVGMVEEDDAAAPGGPLRDYPAPPDATLPHHAPSSLYKFKNNIKQRFSAERHTTVPPHRHQAAKRGRYGSPEGRRDSETCPSPPPSPKYDPPPRSPSPVRRGPGVPIFALHSKGSFYVPLTLDPELLAPHLPEAAGGPGPVLHPVTISVNFQRTGGHVGLLDPPPWKTEVTFPKWSLCAQDRP